VSGGIVFGLKRVFSVLRSSWRLLFRRNEIDQDLDEEVHSHLALVTDEKIAEGMKPEEARRAAKIELGGIEQVKERVRSARGAASLDTLLQDLRFGLRTLRKSPGFTIVAVLTLALGIGASTAVFSIVDAVVFRALPYAHADRLVDVYLKTQNSDVFPVPYPTFLFWQKETRTMTAVGACTDDEFDLSGNGPDTRLSGKRISAGFFSVFGVRPILGRDFMKQDERLTAPGVALVSERFWRNQLGASARVLGRPLELDGKQYTILAGAK
jgi:MacB-like periplasmic core domain